METWKYLVEEVTLREGTEKMQEELDDIGNGGWELVSLVLLPGAGQSKFLAIFKHTNPR
jgi:hypothetical protein